MRDPIIYPGEPMGRHAPARQAARKARPRWFKIYVGTTCVIGGVTQQSGTWGQMTEDGWACFSCLLDAGMEFG